jgi:membrane associated rhomboid family serine protease
LPRHFSGLIGIIFTPFIHGSWDHLFSNSVPLLILGMVVALRGVVRLLKATAIIIVLGGLGTWLIAPSGTDHIGASGLVFGYAAYLIGRGLFSRRMRHLLIGAGVVALPAQRCLRAGPARRDLVAGTPVRAIAGAFAAWWIDGRHRNEEEPAVAAV